MRQTERGHEYHQALHDFIEDIERWLMAVLLVLRDRGAAPGARPGAAWQDLDQHRGHRTRNPAKLAGMGVLRQAKTGRRHTLGARTLVGRSSRADLQLPHPSVSAEHAVIWWDAERWWIRDLGSRNGTRVEAEPGSEAVALEVEVGGQRYRLHLPQVIASTVAIEDRPPSLDEIELRFTVSSDEEHVSLAMIGARGVTDLGSRSYHYALLTLARARSADAELPESAQGWVYVDDLYEQLRLDREQLNMIVFRARKQLAAAGIEDARELVERRVDSNQLRLGVARITIEVA